MCPDRERVGERGRIGAQRRGATLAPPRRRRRVAAGAAGRVWAARKLLAHASSRWLPRLSLPSDLPVSWLTTDPDKQRERRLDTLCHEVASARWYTATLAAQEYVTDYAVRRFLGHADDCEALMDALESGLDRGEWQRAQELAATLRVRDDLFPDVLASVEAALEREPAGA